MFAHTPDFHTPSTLSQGDATRTDCRLVAVGAHRHQQLENILAGHVSWCVALPYAGICGRVRLSNQSAALGKANSIATAAGRSRHAANAACPDLNAEACLIIHEQISGLRRKSSKHWFKTQCTDLARKREVLLSHWSIMRDYGHLPAIGFGTSPPKSFRLQTDTNNYIATAV